ncbi:MAG: oligosaccharide flippase family protein [Myxococcota bacterium]|nr:oligosaccharide flippase family protein [Myxococcota bacterium]
MSQPPAAPPPSPGAATDQAAQVAAGSSVVLAGNLLNRALRFGTSWLLANVLGQYSFGLYELARTVVTVLASFAPLGTDKGVVFFGARQRARGQQGALLGTILSAFGIAVIGGLGLSGATALYLLRMPTTPERETLFWMLPAVAIWSVLLAAVGTLRAYKDMKGQSLAYLVVLPLGMFAAALIPAVTPWGLKGAVLGFCGANLASLAVAVPLVWRKVKPLRLAGKPEWALNPLLRYSLPESFSAVLFRVNQWADTLMVGALAGTQDVGLYRTAVTLAMIGEVPAVAVNTMFQPVIAELADADKPEQLRDVVRIVTRWMVILAAPVYLGIYVGMEAVLSLWKPEYASSADALSILLWGQAAYVLAVPATALIPMTGKARLNLINAGAAALLNVALNFWLIPQYGIQGAATATGISLAAWSAWRLVQVWWLFKIQPFTLRSVALILLFAALNLGGRLGTQDLGLGPQIGATLGAMAVFLVAAALFGRTPDDKVVLDKVTAKIRRKLGR